MDGEVHERVAAPHEQLAPAWAKFKKIVLSGRLESQRASHYKSQAIQSYRRGQGKDWTREAMSEWMDAVREVLGAEGFISIEFNIAGYPSCLINGVLLFS